MRRFFYGKLAWSNIKKNVQTYIPYMLTCAGTVMMYEIMRAMALNKSLLEVRGGATIQEVMNLGSWVIGIFAVIFLFYTNSFLIKRRKKEFGLFNILGMEKRHLARVVLWESVYTYVISMVAGIAAGLLFTRLACLAVERLLNLTMFVKYETAPRAILEAGVLFGVISIVNLLNTLFQIRLSKPVELLKGSNVGEKEPKTKWLLTLLGLICLGAGYFLAITVKNPVDAMMFFFLAVILVIVATYALFTAGSIAVLKIMRKNKKFYYQSSHFISVSGMMYRMKQNAAGLASICVLSTGVLILISTTICLFLGTEDTLRIQNPRNMSVSIWEANETTRDLVEETVASVRAKYEVEPENTLSYYYSNYIMKQDDNHFEAFPDQSLVNYDEVGAFECMTVDEYNQLADRKISLKSDEILLYEMGDKISENSITVAGESYQVKEHLKKFPVPAGAEELIANTYFVVMQNQAAIDQLADILAADKPESGIEKNLNYYYGFDMDLADDLQIQMMDELLDAMTNTGMSYGVSNMASGKSAIYALNGGLLFLGIFLGLLFLMATVLIIYYKQISEGYDDRQRYQIMQKVGMSRKEIKKSIRSQVLTVFYMPLIMAGIHIVVAFNMIEKVMNILSLYNTRLFIICTAGTMVVFAGLYCLVYGLTAKAYYKIIS